MTLTIHSATDLEIALTKHLPTSPTGETTRMEFLQRLSLEIWALDSAAAACAERIVQLVVVVLAVGVVVEDVETACREGCAAGFAVETCLVVAAC